jgi:hypothetical protein
LVLVALAGAAGSALAPPPIQGQATDSPEALARVAATAWARHDARALEALLAPSGITLRLDAQGHTGVNARQARASLEDFFGGFERGEAGVRRAASLGGDPARGIVEILWTAAPRGARDRASRVIFLGLARVGGRWRVVEIRVHS